MELDKLSKTGSDTTSTTIDEYVGKGKTEELVEISTDPESLSMKGSEDAVAELRSRFGDYTPLTIARIVFALSKEECRETLHLFCCLNDGEGLLAVTKLTCVTALYPELFSRLTRLAAKKQELEMFLGVTVIPDVYQTLLKRESWEDPVKAMFAMSPLDSRWADRKAKIGATLDIFEHARPEFVSDLEMVDDVFFDYLDKMMKGIDQTIESLQRILVGLDMREDTMEEALNDYRIGIDTPRILADGKTVGEDMYLPPNPYQVHQFSPYEASTSSYPPRSWRSRLPRPPVHVMLKWQRFQRRMGQPRAMWSIMSVFCTAALVANILAVYKSTSATMVPLPAIDGNFWSALSQSNVAIAAIYSVVIPQLQGQGNAVPAQWRWIFKTLLISSILAALVATCVYPWHAATSIAAAFVSSITQLALTLQIILGAKKKIHELEQRLRSSKRRWRR